MYTEPINPQIAKFVEKSQNLLVYFWGIKFQKKMVYRVWDLDQHSDPIVTLPLECPPPPQAVNIVNISFLTMTASDTNSNSEPIYDHDDPLMTGEIPDLINVYYLILSIRSFPLNF